MRNRNKKFRPNLAGTFIAAIASASTLHNIAAVETPILLHLVGSVGRRLLVECLPASGAIGLAARTDIDGSLAVQKGLQTRFVRFRDPRGNKASTPADALGVHMGIILADSRACKPANQASGRSTCHGTNRSRNKPSSCHHRPHAWNSEQPKARE